MLHSGVDARTGGGRCGCEHRQALKKVFGGSGHTRGGGLVTAPEHVQRPACRDHSRALHATVERRGFTSSEPSSTTSRPGSFPVPHGCRPLWGAAVLGHSPGYNATHPPPIPPPGCRPPPPNRTPRPHPPSPTAPRLPRDQGVCDSARRRGGHKLLDHRRPSPPTAPLRASIMTLTATERTPGNRQVHDRRGPRARAGRPVRVGSGGARGGRAQAGRTGSGRTRRARTGGTKRRSNPPRAILQFVPPGRPIRVVCGAPKCKIAGPAGGPLDVGTDEELPRPRPARRSWSCGASRTPRTGHHGRHNSKIDERGRGRGVRGAGAASSAAAVAGA